MEHELKPCPFCGSEDLAVAIIEILALVMIIVAFAVAVVREKHHPGKKMTPPT